MKIDARKLLAAKGINCSKLVLSQDGEEQDVQFKPARIVFVTPENISAIGPAQKGARLVEMQVGDALVAWFPSGGEPGSALIQAGQDAGVHFDITVKGRPTYQPFTGCAMVAARSRLQEMVETGEELSADHQRILHDIGAVLHGITMRMGMGSHKPAAFGQAALAALADSGNIPAGKLRLSVSYEQFGRKSVSCLLRARIGHMDAEHPDSLEHCDSMQNILKGIGIDPVYGIGGSSFGNEPARKVLERNKILRKQFLGNITSEISDRMQMCVLGGDDFWFFAERYSSSVLEGEWIDEAREAFVSLLAEDFPKGGIDLHAYSIGGRDLFFFCDESGDSPTCLLYSWATAMRAPISDWGRAVTVNMSGSEIPDDIEIARLQTIVDRLAYRIEGEGAIDLDSLSTQSNASEGRS